jgi:hypothetical protein
MLLAFVLALAFLSGGQANEPLPAIRSAEGIVEPIDVSMVQLLADPSSYDGRRVRVVGFCHFEFEGTALYLHREDFEQMIPINGIWLSVGWPVPERLRALNDKYVIVEALFTAQEKGHLSAFAGELKDIRRMAANPSRAEINRILQQAPKQH